MKADRSGPLYYEEQFISVFTNLIAFIIIVLYNKAVLIEPTIFVGEVVVVEVVAVLSGLVVVLVKIIVIHYFNQK